MVSSTRKVASPEKRRGKLIKVKRTTLGLKQSQVAERINERFKTQISQQRISDIERGGDMSVSEFFYICESLNIAIQDLRCLEST